jgi:hypothetical protein
VVLKSEEILQGAGIGQGSLEARFLEEVEGPGQRPFQAVPGLFPKGLPALEKGQHGRRNVPSGGEPQI